MRKGENVINAKRVTLFAGHYGSGKTNVAVNFSLFLKNNEKQVSIYDLDIVNPYFRTIDAKSMLDKFGIDVVVSKYAETNVDIPALNSASYKMIDDKSRYAVVDVGGDDRGALALGRFAEGIVTEDNYDMLFVVNKYRPETRDIKSAIQILQEIEFSGKIKFTGIVNNSNLGIETTKETITSSMDFVNELSKACNLPIKFTAIRKDLAEELKNTINNVLPIELIKYGDWL